MADISFVAGVEYPRLPVAALVGDDAVEVTVDGSPLGVEPPEVGGERVGYGGR